MKIGIDARLIHETGVGRYIRNLIEHLAGLDDKNEYIVFLTRDTLESFTLPNKRWQKRSADVRWHTIREQVVMPMLFLREKLDLVHIPYFNVPILYPKPFVVTIHDLTILHFNTGRATTLPWTLYQLRRLGYWLVHVVGIARARKILAVSHATKQELMDHFHASANKIAVTYEGVDERIKSLELRIKNEKPIIKVPYLLYVGNAYPHKNLEMLVKAFQELISQGLALPRKARPYENKDIRLVLVGKDDFFYRKLQEEVSAWGLAPQVVFFGEASDVELANLYSHALALVFPSFMEGFGLPALEALTQGCPVMSSDIAVFHEILGDAVSYFDPDSIASITQALTKAAAGELPKPTSGQVHSILSKYSWKVMASQTLEVYEETENRL